MARHGLLHRRGAAGDTIEDTQDLAPSRGEHMSSDNDWTLTDAWPGGIWPAIDASALNLRGRVRVSAWAVLGLILSLVGLCATLTGLLAPEGLALGVTGLLASFVGLVRASRPGFTGHSVALLGMFGGLAVTSLAVAAMTGDLGWLNSRTDEISDLHAWLVAHVSWRGRW
jgi:hypothetical protein